MWELVTGKAGTHAPLMWGRTRLLSIGAILGGLAAMLIALGPVGCGQAEAEAEAEDEVDPRYSTADAILEQYNQAMSDTLDLDRFLTLIHVENEEQAELLDRLAMLAPLWSLELAMIDRFGEPLGVDRSHLAAPEPATIVERSDRRAIAEQQTWDNSTSRVHFIETGGRWWVSGYTLEELDLSLEEEDEPFELERMPEVEGTIRHFTSRVRGGEFASLAEAEFMLGMELFKNHPELFEGDPDAQQPPQPGW